MKVAGHELRVAGKVLSPESWNRSPQLENRSCGLRVSSFKTSNFELF